MFTLNETFLKSGSCLIDQRVKLSSIKNIIIKPYEIKILFANSYLNLSTHVVVMTKPFENFEGQMQLQNEGFIDYNYKGLIEFHYKNITNENILIKSGETIGYLVILPYMMTKIEKQKLSFKQNSKQNKKRETYNHS